LLDVLICVHREIRALREVFADQAVEIFVSPCCQGLDRSAK
jgi:hypothetical protein